MKPEIKEHLRKLGLLVGSVGAEHLKAIEGALNCDPNQKRLTLGAIRELHERAGFHSFDRKTLKFFGETIKNYRAGKLTGDGGQFVHRRGGRAGDRTFRFDLTSHTLR